MRAEGPLREVLRGVGEGIVKGYCSECQLASPPLAHHCRLCVACHHQTDHHCLFLNTCIAANNHWYFVVFIMTNIILMTGFLSAAYTATVPPGVQGDWVDRLTAHVHNLLNEDMWTVLMAVCNEASLIWAFYLLKWVFILQNLMLCSHVAEKVRVNMIKYRCLTEWLVLWNIDAGHVKLQWESNWPKWWSYLLQRMWCYECLGTNSCFWYLTQVAYSVTLVNKSILTIGI